MLPELKKIIAALVVIFCIVGLSAAQELAGSPITVLASNKDAIVATEKDSRWELSPQGPRETLDLRVMGINPNTLRDSSMQGLYHQLATHILMVVDRKMANEVYRRTNCEEEAAQHIRALFILPEADGPWRSIQLQKMRNYIPGGDSRLCATISGRYYGMRHFYYKDTLNDHQFEMMKLQGSSIPMDPRTLFVAEEVVWLPCER